MNSKLDRPVTARDLARIILSVRGWVLHVVRGMEHLLSGPRPTAGLLVGILRMIHARLVDLADRLYGLAMDLGYDPNDDEEL